MTGSGKARARILYGAIGMVIAIALLLAGLIDTGSAPQSSPVRDAPQASTIASQSRLVQDAVLHRNQTTVQPDEWNESVDPPEWEGPSLTVTVRFRVRPNGAAEEGDFNHPVALWADGALVADTHPPGLRLPAAARAAVFKTLGYRPISREVPTALGGTVDFGDVVFEPDAAVRVRLSGAPVDGDVRFAIGKTLSAPHAQSIRTLTGGAAEALLPAPSGEKLLVSAFTCAGAIPEWFAVECRSLQLRSGETAQVELAPLSGARVTVLVQGPSPALLPHLTVALWLRTPNWFAPHLESPATSLDAQGRALFRAPADRCEVGVMVAGGARLLTASDGSGTQHQLTEGAVLAMTPVEPLVGLIVRHAGDPVQSRFSLMGPIGDSGPPPPADCHILTQSGLQQAKRLHFSTEATGELSCGVEDLQMQGDIAYLDTDRGRARAMLSVHAELPEDYYQSLGIRAEPLAGGPAIRIGSQVAPFRQTLPCGVYRLRWTCNGGVGPVIDDQLELRPGEHREIAAFLPTLVKWEGVIRDQEILGGASLCFGEVHSVGAYRPGSTITVLLPGATRPDTPSVYLHLLKLVVPAQVVSLDEASHTFVVAHGLTQTDRVRLSSTGLGTGKRQIALTSLLPDNTVPAWLWESADIPMLPGSERNGCLCEVIDKERQVTRWFTVRHGAGEFVIEPRGHWATVRVENENGFTIQVEGWPGMPVQQVGQLKGPAERRIFVAEGTRAVHLVRPQGRLTFSPDVTEIVVR